MFKKLYSFSFLSVLILSWLCLSSVNAALPKDLTIVPFYDINDTALSFIKAEQSVVGMNEVPGMPEHFLVLGYFGYV